jgi:hypothetical protein
VQTRPFLGQDLKNHTKRPRACGELVMQAALAAVSHPDANLVVGGERCFVQDYCLGPPKLTISRRNGVCVCVCVCVNTYIYIFVYVIPIDKQAGSPCSNRCARTHPKHDMDVRERRGRSSASKHLLVKSEREAGGRLSGDRDCFSRKVHTHTHTHSRARTHRYTRAHTYRCTGTNKSHRS